MKAIDQPDWLENFNVILIFFYIHILEAPPKDLLKLIFNNISGACISLNVDVTL